jgi:hypothetical protein
MEIANAEVLRSDAIEKKMSKAELRRFRIVEVPPYFVIERLRRFVTEWLILSRRRVFVHH